MESQYVVIRISGEINKRQDHKDTLRMLHLVRKHNCVILSATPVNKGMIKKVKDFITWGEVTPETIKLLKEKRERMIINKEGKKVASPVFTLHPPRGGYERKGTKVHFVAGGALGYRGEKINDLVKRMI